MDWKGEEEKEEVDGLMNLLVQSISNEVEELNNNGVRMLSIGDDSQLPIDAQEELESAKKRTEKKTEREKKKGKKKREREK